MVTPVSKKSIAEAEQAVREAVATFGKRHPTVASRLDEYAILLRELQLSEYAEKFEAIAAEIREQRTLKNKKAGKRLSAAIQNILDQFDGTAGGKSGAPPAPPEAEATERRLPAGTNSGQDARAPISVAEAPVEETPGRRLPAGTDSEKDARVPKSVAEPPIEETPERRLPADTDEVPAPKAEPKLEAKPILPAGIDQEKQLQQRRIWNMTFLLIFSILLMILGFALLQSALLVRLF